MSLKERVLPPRLVLTPEKKTSLNLSSKNALAIAPEPFPPKISILVTLSMSNSVGSIKIFFTLPLTTATAPAVFATLTDSSVIIIFGGF